jgi:hypothetical protein
MTNYEWVKAVKRERNENKNEKVVSPVKRVNSEEAEEAV